MDFEVPVSDRIPQSPDEPTEILAIPKHRALQRRQQGKFVHLLVHRCEVRWVAQFDRTEGSEELAFLLDGEEKEAQQRIQHLRDNVDVFAASMSALDERQVL